MNALCLLLLVVATAASAQQVPLKDLARHEQYRDVKISPDGEYIATTAVVKDKTVLSIIRLADISGVNVRPADHDDVVNFWWIGSRRIVYSVTERIFGLDGAFANGEIYGINADGSNKGTLYSYRRSRGTEGFAEIDGKLGTTGKLLTEVTPLGRCEHGAFPTARALDVGGSMEVLATAPICGAHFIADNGGVVRFAYATDEDQFNKVFYRRDATDSWRLLFDESVTHVRYIPQRFNRDGSGAYFTCPGTSKVGGVCRWDVKSEEMHVVWSGAESGAEDLISSLDGRDLIAIGSLPGRPALTLLDKTAEGGRFLADMLKQFPGQQVSASERTTDGKKAIVHVWSDINPGEFYLYDANPRKLTLLLSSRPWIKPEQMAPQEPIKLKARDGTPLHGYLTRAVSVVAGNGQPLVVFVHGGPYELRDRWGFDPYVQAMATRGYAVLQVNFRGSGGYGDDFVKAGVRQWGGNMQDDITDATHWVIDQGIADPRRICIFGGSYGGYAALEGVVKEPELYKCAIGYVGVYDLRLMFDHGDIPRTRFGKNYVKMVLGDDQKELTDRSPVSHADKIKASIMLIAGGADDRVPEDHAKEMRSQLQAHGITAEWLYDRTEGHGFYREEHLTELFDKVIAFLDRNIGAGVALHPSESH